MKAEPKKVSRHVVPPYTKENKTEKLDKIFSKVTYGSSLYEKQVFIWPRGSLSLLWFLVVQKNLSYGISGSFAWVCFLKRNSKNVAAKGKNLKTAFVLF